jgi:hypothetical protein
MLGGRAIQKNNEHAREIVRGMLNCSHPDVESATRVCSQNGFNGDKSRDYLKGVALKLKENCSSGGGSAQSGCNLFM